MDPDLEHPPLEVTQLLLRYFRTRQQLILKDALDMELEYDLLYNEMKKWCLTFGVPIPPTVTDWELRRKNVHLRPRPLAQEK